MAEAERADEEARERAKDFLKYHATDPEIFDLEVMRNIRETAWRKFAE